MTPALLSLSVDLRERADFIDVMASRMNEYIHFDSLFTIFLHSSHLLRPFSGGPLCFPVEFPKCISTFKEKDVKRRQGEGNPFYDYSTGSTSFNYVKWIA